MKRNKISMKSVQQLLGDIFPIVERHNRYYENKLSDLVQEDKIPSFFRDDDKGADISIGFGYILTIERGWFPWEKITVRHPINAEKYMKYVLDKLGLSRFIDEDAPGQGLFTSKDIDSNMEIAVCFTNPDFPKGYLENHVLDFEKESKRRKKCKRK